jgi:hypothetical protein
MRLLCAVSSAMAWSSNGGLPSGGRRYSRSSCSAARRLSASCGRLWHTVRADFNSKSNSVWDSKKKSANLL